jgi:hypothetical protein
MPEWYVSYAWGDNRTAEGRAREEIVDRLCAAASDRRIQILRDKNVLNFGGSISAFMRRIGIGDRVFVVLSDKYLRSPFCMFELSEIWRTSSQEGSDFLKRVRIYALPDAKVWTPMDWTDWAIYWKQEHDVLDGRARQYGATILGEHGHRRLMQLQRFYTQVADILGTLADIVQPRTFEELERYGFENAEPRTFEESKPYRFENLRDDSEGLDSDENRDLGQQHQIGREARASDDFIKIVDQLGNQSVNTRIGGIIGLGRLLRTAAIDGDYWSLMDFLRAFVRQSVPVTDAPRRTKPSEDIQAAINVLARRSSSEVPMRIYDSPVDLSQCDLSYLWMAGGHYEGGYFVTACLGMPTLGTRL